MSDDVSEEVNDPSEVIWTTSKDTENSDLVYRELRDFFKHKFSSTDIHQADFCKGVATFACLVFGAAGVEHIENDKMIFSMKTIEPEKSE